MRAVVYFDTTRPHSARMYDYYLGGKDHYQVDKDAAEKVKGVFPSVGLAARVNRAFMHRATRYVAGEGVRQFLDVGTGIPTAPNLHQVAQEIAPDARIVYVDNDPLVLAHARALLNGTEDGCIEYVDADVTTPDKILSAQGLEILDLRKPVAVSLVALLHFIPDHQKPREIIDTLMGAVPSGSFLVLSHATTDFDPVTFAEIERIYRDGCMDTQFRRRDEFAEFFTGLELIEPGIVVPHQWWPDGPVTTSEGMDAKVSFYAAVARKP